MAEIAPDTIIDGRYRVHSRLGTGGMADVFLAEDQQLGRKVALKLLHRRFAEDPAFVERFRREAQAAAGLQHQNIVSVYDRGEWDGTYYIAMEYLPGRTLKQIIREEAPLDPIRAIDIAIQLLKAASFAHRRGIIHRDLKPHNVMVDDADNAKVTDFGIARAGASDMTETGSIMGTAQYLSPEQAQGHSVTASSDLYSIGVVLYEMLTGRVPFDGEAAVTIALKHVSEAPTPPREITPGIPPELEQTVLWTLNKNPSDRPGDADQLITVLQHCRDAILAGAAGQHTASMAAVAAGAAAGLPIEGLPELPPPAPAPATNGSGPIPVVVAHGNGGPPDEEPEEGGGWRPWLLGLLIVLLIAGAAAAAYFLSRPKRVTVPNVVSDRLNTARTALQNAGLQVGSPIVYVTRDKAAGTVIAESPAGGSKAEKGAPVTLTVSQGRGNVDIPAVVGESQAKAIKDIKAADLKIARIAYEPSKRFADGEAVGTTPVSGRAVARGTKVVLFVSNGAPEKSVPSVVSATEAAATSTLQNAGFKVNPEQQISSSVTAGNVISQSPAANATERIGTSVTIVVATAPATNPVPSVTNDPEAGAESALKALGFAVSVATRPVSDSDKAGLVVSQTPPGGSQRKKGAVVTIVIGSFKGTTTPVTTTTSSITTTTTTTTPTTSSSSSSSSSSTPTTSSSSSSSTVPSGLSKTTITSG